MAAADELRDLRKRVLALERHTGAGGTLIGALADAVPRVVNDIIDKRRCLAYRGIWQPGENYPPGSAVTRSGSVWAAMTPTKGEAPGNGSEAWKLIAKGQKPKEPALK